MLCLPHIGPTRLNGNILTPRQKQCLDFISSFWDEHNYAPSFGEIAKALDAKSRSSVTPLVSKLEGRGYIERIPNLARSIRVIKADAPQASVISDVSPDLSESTTTHVWGEE